MPRQSQRGFQVAVQGRLGAYTKWDHASASVQTRHCVVLPPPRQHTPRVYSAFCSSGLRSVQVHLESGGDVTIVNGSTDPAVPLLAHAVARQREEVKRKELDVKRDLSSCQVLRLCPRTQELEEAIITPAPPESDTQAAALRRVFPSLLLGVYAPALEGAHAMSRKRVTPPFTSPQQKITEADNPPLLRTAAVEETMASGKDEDAMQKGFFSSLWQGMK